MKRLLSTIFFICLFVVVSAQQITVNAPSSVYAGDNFTVTFVVNAHVKDFQQPDFGGLERLAGPSTSTSSNISIVNGQMNKSVQTSYTYRLMAHDEGDYTISEAACTIEGKRIASKSVTIHVEKMSAARQQPSSPSSQQPSSPSSIQNADASSLFARISVNKSDPYLGEQILVTYKIYTQVQISQYQIDKLPGNKGFWAEDLSAGRQVRQYQETIDGRNYYVVEIRKGALFAQQTGSQTIEPLDLTVLAMVQRPRQRTGSFFDFFDDAFFNPMQAVERQLHSNKVNINVKPLPNAPEGYAGAVGSFDVRGGTVSNTVKTNDAISYRITVHGSGNLPLMNAPNPDFPSVFEVYEPQISDNIRRDDNGISGSRTYEWVLIPRSQGEYVIPEYRFTYFDPARRQYVTKTIAEQTISVARGESHGSSSVTSKDDVKILNSDINYIVPIKSLSPINRNGRVPLWFWILSLLLVAGGFVSVMMMKKRDRDVEDVAGTRMKRATRMARKRLRRAAALLDTDDVDLFYEEIYKAIWGCLSDKYNIELARLNRDTVSEYLDNRHVDAMQQQTIMRVLQEVDIARFAPGDATQQKHTIYNEALQMIASL